jgi:hypothetical protein
MTRRVFNQSDEKIPALVMRIATFSGGHGPLDEYRDFVDAHLFPTLRAVPGYVGAFLGHDSDSTRLISVSFWRSEADVVSGEEAVASVVRALPPGTAPRPSTVEKFIVEYRDLSESFPNR